MSGRDRILLPEFSFEARVGLLPGESELPQALAASVEICLDLASAAERDAIAESFDYRIIPEIVERAAAQGPCDLLECLAGRILTAILEDRRVESAGVRLSKQAPPLGPEYGFVVVELWRRRETA